MQVTILSARPHAPLKFETIASSEFLARPCAVCQSASTSRPLSRVKGREGDVSLEYSFCSACEHFYFSRYPGEAWLQKFYGTTWDLGSPKVTSPGRLRSRFSSRPLRRRLAAKLDSRLRRIALMREDLPALKIRAMLEGAVFGDGSYQVAGSVHKVLDVGCGFGLLLDFFARAGFEAHGTETSEVRLAACRAKGLNVHACEIDDFEPVRSLAPFDFIYSTHVLEHSVNPSKSLRLAADLLRPGGYFYIQVPHGPAESNPISRSHSLAHAQGFTLRSLSLLMKACGLQPVRCLIDMNLHVLAVKESAPHDLFPALEPPQRMNSTTRWEQFWKPALGHKQPLRFEWDYSSYQWSGVNGTFLSPLQARSTGIHLKPQGRHVVDISVAEDNLDTVEFLWPEPVILLKNCG